MNKRERVLAAVAGDKPDRVPGGFWLHFPPGFEAGEEAVKRHLEFFDKSGTDLCKVMNENSLPDNPALNKAAGRSAGNDSWYGGICISLFGRRRFV